MKNKLKLNFLLILVFSAIVIFLQDTNGLYKTKSYDRVTCDSVINSAPSIQLYFYIKQYAKMYNIPESFAFAMAYEETRYQGPMHLKYNHRQISSAGAVGPMQIMPATAKYILGQNIHTNRLKNDIELNVSISMKYLRKLYNLYKNWGMAFGAYNTGRPCINQYARNILSKRYHWI